MPRPAPIDETLRQVATGLARAFLHGDSSPAAMRQRGRQALGKRWPWLSGLVHAIRLEIGETPTAGQHDEIVRLILGSPDFVEAFEAFEAFEVSEAFGDRAPAPRLKGYFPYHPPMGEPPRALAGLALPQLPTPGDIARWLDVSPTELDWFADVDGWGGYKNADKLRHYRYRWLAKRSGGFRLIEAPKPRLRAIQQRILHDILDRIPPHAAAHGCVRGRSILSNAETHVGAPLVLRVDLRDFFAGIRASRVHALFRTLGYPEASARYLTGLTTHCAARSVLAAVPTDDCASVEQRRERRGQAREMAARHLPQGAPTSPALANLCAWRLDLRLAGAAGECGARYTRYVDDIVVSCASACRAQGWRIVEMVYGIAVEEGFTPNPRKTRLMPAARAQRVTGLVVNERVNLPRREYDTLKAILTNCLRHGPDSQNRRQLPDFRAHLRGRVAHAEHVAPQRGERLRALFDGIVWPEERAD